MLLLPVIPLVIVLAASLVAAVTDVWKYQIYNILTWPLLISGLVYHSVAFDGMGLVLSLLGFSVGFLPMGLIYMSGGMGAGDVKLMAALGAWFGPVLTIQVLFASWLAAGLYAAGILLWNALASGSGRVRYRLGGLVRQDSGEQISQLVASPNRRRRLIPFGVMILAGVLATLMSNGRILS